MLTAGVWTPSLSFKDVASVVAMLSHPPSLPIFSRESITLSSRLELFESHSLLIALRQVSPTENPPKIIFRAKRDQLRSRLISENSLTHLNLPFFRYQL